jgi:hypothetical protein
MVSVDIRGIRWIALIVSWVVDIGGSTLFGIALLAWAFAVGRIPSSVASDPTALQAALTNQPDLFATGMAGGLFFSVIAGYVAARMAGVRPLLHGLLSSAACLATDATSLDSLARLPVWLAALGVLFAPAAGLFGAYVRTLELRRRPVAV